MFGISCVNERLLPSQKLNGMRFLLLLLAYFSSLFMGMGQHQVFYYCSNLFAYCTSPG
jgi:hypothetical protein